MLGYSDELPLFADKGDSGILAFWVLRQPIMPKSYSTMLQSRYEINQNLDIWGGESNSVVVDQTINYYRVYLFKLIVVRAAKKIYAWRTCKGKLLQFLRYLHCKLHCNSEELERLARGDFGFRAGTNGVCGHIYAQDQILSLKCNC